MKYYLIRNFGYDGLSVDQFDDLLEAERYVKNLLREQTNWDEKYPDTPSDKGAVVIRGDIIISDHESEIFG